MRLTIEINLKKALAGGLLVLLLAVTFWSSRGSTTNSLANSLAGAPIAPLQNVPVVGGKWVPGTLEIHHLYVGQGDSVLVISPSGKTLLYDVGERDWPLHENAEMVAQYVWQVTGKREIDYVVLSHFHQDHVGNSKLTESKSQYDGGIFWLLRTGALKVKKVIDRGFEPILPRTPIAVKYKEFAESSEGKRLLNRETAQLGLGQIDLGKEIGVTIIAANGKAFKDGKTIQVLPEAELKADPPPSENDLSLCLKLNWNDFEYFIGGDLSGQEHVSQYGYKYHDVETGVAEAVGNVEVYRVSHHGSDHSTNPRLLSILDPEVSINSSGTGNRFGHPRQSVIDSLLDTGDLFVTSREGGAASAQYKRSVEGGTVVVRAFNGGYNYEVALVRSYRSYTDQEEARKLDQLVDYEQQQVRYEESQGRRKPEDDDDGSNSGDIKAGKDEPGKAENGRAEPAGAPVDEATEKNGFPRVRAKDRNRLVHFVGKKAYIWGRVTSTFTPASNKVKFLNIDTEDLKKSFTVVIFNKDWPNFFEAPGIGDPCKYYQNKWIEVSGVVITYQDKKGGKTAEAADKEAEAAAADKLELIISGPHQIQVLPYRQEK